MAVFNFCNTQLSVMITSHQILESFSGHIAGAIAVNIISLTIHNIVLKFVVVALGICEQFGELDQQDFKCSFIVVIKRIFNAL